MKMRKVEYFTFLQSVSLPKDSGMSLHSLLHGQS